MRETGKRKGFVTMATGREEYYILAHNLLLSYKFHSKDPVPFAIICDKENEYTADFDDVVLMDNPKYSVFDKLRLPELAPYDETIFIEADCLVYRDLNGMWDVFKDSPDFGGLGVVRPFPSEKGWIPPEYLGKYKDKVKEQYMHQGGVYFMRKNNLKEFSATCEEINRHREDFHFALPNEEPVFILACILHGYRPVTDWVNVFCYYPVVTITKLNIKKGILRFYLNETKGPVMPGSYILHWATPTTREDVYKREAEAVRSAMERGGRASAFLPFNLLLAKINYRLTKFVKSVVPLPVKRFFKRYYL